MSAPIETKICKSIVIKLSKEKLTFSKKIVNMKTSNLLVIQYFKKYYLIINF